jgi:molybdenum cofactor cytidylyltransferase
MSQLPCVVILAAGKGSRYRQEAGGEQDKLLAHCRGLDGVVRPVLEQTLINLPQGLSRRVLVTAPERAAVIKLAEAYGCQVLLLDSDGMGHSIAQAVSHTADAAGWLIVLGDMPFIQPETIERVVSGLQVSSISVAQMNGCYGHPVAFTCQHAQGLMALSGDRGARVLFVGEQVQAVNVNDPGIFWDVDVPASLDYCPD